MKTVEIIGYKRDQLGKQESKDLRAQGYAPCVLYGGKENLHFYTPMILFRDVIYTGDACFVLLNLEGDEYRCVLQDAQFHPVSEVLLHVDFLLLQDDKPVKMEIPIRFVGSSPGLQKGGKLVSKLRKLKVVALPGNMPDVIEVDISTLDLGKSVKVGAIKQDNFTILNNPLVTIASIDIPRALRGQQQQ